MRDSGNGGLLLDEIGDGHRLASVSVAAAPGRAGHRNEIRRCGPQAFHDIPSRVQRELAFRREHLHREGGASCEARAGFATLAALAAFGRLRADCASSCGGGHAYGTDFFENADDGFHERRVSFLVRIFLG